MQHQVIPNPPSESTAAADVAAEHTPDQPLVEITLELAICVIATQRNLLDARDLRIRALEKLLKLAADQFVPPNVVIH
jgi:hypothetical protein